MIGAPGGVPYEAPERPDLVIDSAGETPEQSADRLAGFVAARTAAACTASPAG
jgi:adenylylsulfate kinase-like enzyme